MKTLRGWITTTFLLMALVISAAPANANGGIIFGGDLQQPTSTNCNQADTQKTVATASDSVVGIIFGGLVGIIFGGGSASTECGIIFGGN